MKKKTKYLTLLSMTSILLVACNDKEVKTNDVFKDFVVDESDLIEETEPKTVLSKEEEDMIARTEDNYTKAIEEYEREKESLGEEGSNVYNEDGTYKDNIVVYQQLEEFNKFDAMHLLDILNIYHDYYKEKDAFISTVVDLNDLSSAEVKENNKLNNIILDSESKGLYEKEFSDKNLIVLYEALEQMGRLIGDLAHIEINVTKNSININQYNAYKTEYQYLETRILTAIGLSDIMDSQEFRYK